MNIKFLTAVLLLTPLSFASPASAENPRHLTQLRATNECALCDLSGINLSNADLRGADLAGADLTATNLRGRQSKRGESSGGYSGGY